MTWESGKLEWNQQRNLEVVQKITNQCLSKSCQISMAGSCTMNGCELQGQTYIWYKRWRHKTKGQTKATKLGWRLKGTWSKQLQRESEEQGWMETNCVCCKESHGLGMKKKDGKWESLTQIIAVLDNEVNQYLDQNKNKNDVLLTARQKLSTRKSVYTRLM